MNNKNFYYKKLLAFFLKRGLSQEQADDLIQQTFIQLFEKRGCYRLGVPADAWIFVVARSQFLSWVRTFKKQSIKINDYQDFLLSQSQVHQAYSESDMNSKFSELSEEDLRLLSDRFEKGLSFKELAHQWGKSSESLRKRVSRLYQFLKNEVGVKK